MSATAQGQTAGSPSQRRPARATTLGEEFAGFCRHRNPQVELSALLVAAGARVALGGWGAGDVIVVAVLLAAQPFFEWSFHIWVLHYRPLTVFGRTVDFELARKHRDHHADPTDVDLVFVPLRSLVKAYAVAAVLALWLLPSVASALMALTAGAALLLTYEWVHYLIHSRYRPKSRLYRALWRAHRLHHYKNEQYWFGVTNPAADYVLGTAPPPGSVPTSPTARDLSGAGMN